MFYAVYIYDLNTNPLADPVRFSKGSPNYDFGHSVSISGNNIIVGEPHIQGQPNYAYIYKYENDTWTETQVINKDDYRYGWSVSITDNHAIIGAPGQYPNPGIAHIT